jgi:hypothetical protein
MSDPTGAAGVVQEGGLPEEHGPPCECRAVCIHHHRIHDLQGTHTMTQFGMCSRLHSICDTHNNPHDPAAGMASVKLMGQVFMFLGHPHAPEARWLVPRLGCPPTITVLYC